MFQKCLSDGPLDADDGPMDTDEGPLINENSNGLSHLLTEGEFNSVDAVGVDESSTSNHAFLNAVEFSAGSVGDYLENNTDGFNTDSFDVGDNAVTFAGDSMNNVLSDCDSRLSDAAYKAVSDTDNDMETPAKMEMDNEISELSNDIASDTLDKTDEETAVAAHEGEEESASLDTAPVEEADVSLKSVDESVKLEDVAINEENDKQELAAEVCY